MGMAKRPALATHPRRAQVGFFYLPANSARVVSNSHLVPFEADIHAIAVDGRRNASPSSFDRRNEDSD